MATINNFPRLCLQHLLVKDSAVFKGTVEFRGKTQFKGPLVGGERSPVLIDDDVCITGELKMDGDLCSGTFREVQRPVIPYPMDTIPLTPDPEGSPFEGVVNANGVRITWLNPNAGNNGPWYFSDKEGRRVLQCGIEEPTPFYNGPADNLPPVSTTTATVRVEVPDSPWSNFKLKLRWSVEFGTYDFCIAAKNGVEFFRADGFKLTPPYYNEVEVQFFAIKPTDSFEITFEKDDIWRGGYDSIYFYIEDLETTEIQKTTATIKGDLCVNRDLKVGGCIDNIQLEFLEDCYRPVTDEVYETQQRAVNFFPGFSFHPTLRNVCDYDIDTVAVAGSITETDPAPSANIYGYNSVDPNMLDLSGGPAKSYETGQYETFAYRYHGDDDGYLTMSGPTNMKAAYDRIISWIYKRGLPFQGPDIPAEYAEKGWLVHQTFALFALKFVFENGIDAAPTAVDLTIGPNGFAIFASEYEPDEENRVNGFLYPVRLPIVTELDTFKFFIEKSIPVVYYNCSQRKITINYPDTAEATKMGTFLTDLPDCDFFRKRNFYMKCVSGTFLLSRRNRNNEVIPAVAADVEFMTQVSNDLKTIFTVVELDNTDAVISSNDNGGVFPSKNMAGYYSGLNVSKLNGGNNSFDSYTYVWPELNAFVNYQQPYHQFGSDNPTTTVIESFATSNYTHFFDTPEWFDFERKLPADTVGDFATGSWYPESRASIGPHTAQSGLEIVTQVQLHEYVHNMHAAQGTIRFVPTEGIATGIEQDERFFKDLIAAYRPPVWFQVIWFTIRGLWPVSCPHTGVTYGHAVFYKFWCHEHGTAGFDPNWQVQRRQMDILTSETIGPYLASQNTNLGNDLDFGGPGFCLGNCTGRNLALDQAMDEIHGKSLKDVYTDYAISLTMLRNNTAIPASYRTHYPYCLLSAAYPDHATLNSSSYAGYATLWDSIQSNNVSPTFRGESDFFPVLTGTSGTVSPAPIEDMSMYIYDVQYSTVSSVKVTVVSGEWRLAMVQFTSNGMPSGVFTIDGVHTHMGGGMQTFDVNGGFSALPAPPTPPEVQTGRIRLVCVHVSLNDYGSVADNFKTFGDPPTGAYFDLDSPRGSQLTGEINIAVTPLPP